MRARVAGSPAPGSPAWMVTATLPDGRSTPETPGHLRQVQGVGRRADQHRRLVGGDRPDPLLGAHAATGYDQRPEAARPFAGAPEADEGPEREGEEDAVAAAHSGAGVHLPPAASPPVPAPGGVEPAQALAGGARGQVQAGVLVALEGEVGAVRRVAGLVEGELFLGGERQPRVVGGGVSLSPAGSLRPASAAVFGGRTGFLSMTVPRSSLQPGQLAGADSAFCRRCRRGGRPSHWIAQTRLE